MQFLCPDAFQNALFAQNEPAEQVPTNARHSNASSIADSVEYIFVLAPAGNTHNGMPSILPSPPKLSNVHAARQLEANG